MKRKVFFVILFPVLLFLTNCIQMPTAASSKSQNEIEVSGQRKIWSPIQFHVSFGIDQFWSYKKSDLSDDTYYKISNISCNTINFCFTKPGNYTVKVDIDDNISKFINIQIDDVQKLTWSSSVIIDFVENKTFLSLSDQLLNLIKGLNPDGTDVNEKYYSRMRFGFGSNSFYYGYNFETGQFYPINDSYYVKMYESTSPENLNFPLEIPVSTPLTVNDVRKIYHGHCIIDFSCLYVYIDEESEEEMTRSYYQAWDEIDDCFIVITDENLENLEIPLSVHIHNW